MPAPSIEFRPPPSKRVELQPRVSQQPKKVEIPPNSPEAQMLDLLRKPTSNPDSTLKALASESADNGSPEPVQWKNPPKPEGASGVAARIGHLQMQLEKRNMPDDIRSRYQAQIMELQTELKVLAGESRAYVSEKKLEEIGVSQGEGSVETNKRQDLIEMESAEKGYIEQNIAKMEGLDAKYADERTEADYVQKQIEDFAKVSGLHHEDDPVLAGQSFNTESRRIIGDRVQRHIDTLLNSDKGRKNPEKHKMVTTLTNRYLDLMAQAQTEGDLPANLDAQTVLRLVEQNVWTLAFQDRVASENLLGDHGIRHLNYDITSAEAILDELAKNGQKVRSIDRLLIHQVITDHDLGYGMDPVRQQVNRNIYADPGHNVLAAKYERQRADNANDPICKVFSADQLRIIHEGILHHDSSEINFHLGDPGDKARQDNIHSAIRVADNTHAFEDKLPELLYSYPDTLRIMRLMKTAGETGDIASFQKLQGQLVTGIKNNPDYSRDDKDALTQAAHSLTTESYRFNVGRICGNKPEFAMDQNGILKSLFMSQRFIRKSWDYMENNR